MLPADPHTHAITQQLSPSEIHFYTSVDPACSSYILDNIILTAVEEMINTNGGDSKVPCYTVGTVSHRKTLNDARQKLL